MQRMQREDKMVGGEGVLLRIQLLKVTKSVNIFVCVLQDLVFLRRVFPRLQVWFDWFNETQVRLSSSSHTVSSVIVH